MHSLAGIRSIVGVPLLRDDRVEGALLVARFVPGPFDQRQIELLQTFADQAVIAIENVRLFEEVQARTRDLTEALQQQTATADVLKVISRSAFDLKAVLAVLVQSVLDLCNATGGNIHLRDGETFRLEMQLGWPEDFAQYMRDHPVTPGTGSVSGRAILTGAIAHIPDVLEDPDYELSEGPKIAGYRALLGVPLLRQTEVIGVFSVGRPAPGSFTRREIELVQTFADQAVIAIENVRLFDEVQARTRDLTEALQQQTATADVLKVISRSAFDLQAVLDTLVQSAQRLCNARGSMIFVRDGEVYRVAAHVGMPEAFVSFRMANPLRADRRSAVGRVALTGELVHLPDVLADPDIQKLAAQLGDFRAVLSVPLVREDEVVGIFALNRPEPGLFAPAQVKLVQTFADQAAIAIANVRLFNEVKTKTDDLSEALQQQTATADVLKVISRSAFDLQAVLDTLVEWRPGSARRIWRDLPAKRDGLSSNRELRLFAAIHQFMSQNTDPAGRGSIAGRTMALGKALQVQNILEDPIYEFKQAAVAGGLRAMLGVPLLREGVPIGVIVLSRKNVRPFSEKQIELIETFADQAVIAIENVRLFDEVQARTRDLSEALQQQTATADVLKVISRSAFDLQLVLETLVETAAQLCEARDGVHSTRDGEVFEGGRERRHSRANK